MGAVDGIDVAEMLDELATPHTVRLPGAVTIDDQGRTTQAFTAATVALFCCPLSGVDLQRRPELDQNAAWIEVYSREPLPVGTEVDYRDRAHRVMVDDDYQDIAGVSIANAQRIGAA